MQEFAGVDCKIFYSWTIVFVEETKYLRRNGDNILLMMGGYACHISYKTLKSLRDNEIIVARLTAHKSNVLQSLDVSVFAPLKEDFKRLLTARTV